MEWWNALSKREKIVAVVLGAASGLGLLYLASRRGAASGNTASVPGPQQTAYNPDPNAVMTGNPLSSPFDFNITVEPNMPTAGQTQNPNPGSSGSSSGGGTGSGQSNAPGGTLGGSGTMLPPVTTHNPDGSTTYSGGFVTGAGTPFHYVTQTAPLPPMGPSPPVPNLPSVSSAPAPIASPLETVSPGPLIPSDYGVAAPIPVQPPLLPPTAGGSLVSPSDSSTYQAAGVPNVPINVTVQAAGGMSPDQPLPSRQGGSILTSPENIPL